jgi:hypothetical protein
MSEMAAKTANIESFELLGNAGASAGDAFPSAQFPEPPVT